MARNLVPYNFTKIDGLITGDVAVNTADYTVIGTYVVPQGEEISFGEGLFGSLADAVGRAYADFKDAANAAITGLVRILVTDMNDDTVYRVMELHTSVLSQGANDPRLRRPFPAQKQGAGFGRKVKVFFKADAAATISKANSTVELSARKAFIR